ncbi:hypothetical protein DRZ77_02395 [Candidatus Woesearchaeota archaeon]|nr:hypothetical protein [Candidatus Woesearchaeota archaeon]RLE40410.1 MAG: hypothetical protein DRZ77_02395 [Candidatus Woesearchaeota archaeon]
MHRKKEVLARAVNLIKVFLFFTLSFVFVYLFGKDSVFLLCYCLIVFSFISILFLRCSGVWFKEKILVHGFYWTEKCKEIR